MKKRVKEWFIHFLNRKLGLYTTAQLESEVESTWTAAKTTWGKAQWIGCLRLIRRGEIEL